MIGDRYRYRWAGHGGARLPAPLAERLPRSGDVLVVIEERPAQAGLTHARFRNERTGREDQPGTSTLLPHPWLELVSR